MAARFGRAITGPVRAGNRRSLVTGDPNRLVRLFEPLNVRLGEIDVESFDGGFDSGPPITRLTTPENPFEQ